MKRRHKERTKKVKTKSIKSLKKEADRIFSIYIRTKYSVNGMVKCYTCQAVKPIKEMQNGHYVSRKCNRLRYDENNCRPQCYSCNVCNHGEQSLFGKLLDKEAGFGISDNLMYYKNVSWKFTTEELEKIIEKYSNKISQLLASKAMG